MEGLIPFVYKAVVQYRNGGRQASNMGNSSWYSESSISTSYMRLPTDGGESGRFQDTNQVELFSSNSMVVTATSAVQSPLVSRRLVSSSWQ
ncbi:hypothetical protein C5167_040677 [Papaver somniferum]|uniref:Uncharacterized protein n=1 Tax=Papaver somniferum TaxID=3469 RepID=A0A4Y7IJ49_PAPSO|nr:uncharacterized protein LOC113271410 [Papaver somniferum]RZC47732.1 hypothetical protein C5167_040677 [Papaver somniferum]